MDTIVIQDQQAKLECLVDSLPKSKITWYMNGKEITLKDNIKFETDTKTFANYLVIPKVQAVHFGSYTIKASNIVGEIEHSFKLDVLGIYFYFLNIKSNLIDHQSIFT